MLSLQAKSQFHTCRTDAHGCMHGIFQIILCISEENGVSLLDLVTLGELVLDFIHLRCSIL